jgi:hypothetical protein
MMMIQAYGNATVVPDQVQETPEAWIFTHVFVDHETGVSTPRQWRESKRSVVEGNMDKERKDAIRFGCGQSKNIRNAILHSMPKWLVNKAIEQAKQGARDKLERFIKDNGMAAAQLYTVQQLARYGVKEEHIWLFGKFCGSQSTALMKDTIAKVLKVAEAESPALDQLDLGVRAFDETVGDPLVKVGEDLMLPATYGLHKLQ